MARDMLHLITFLFLSLLAPTTVTGFVQTNARNIVSYRSKLNKDHCACSFRRGTIQPLDMTGATDWVNAAHNVAIGNLASYIGPPFATTFLSDIQDTQEASALAAATPPGLDDTTKLGLSVFAGIGVAAAGFKAIVYWRMQYVIASLLTNRVPSLPGGAEVLELGATDTKTLYYLPAANVRRVILSTIKELDQNIVNGVAIQAKIPLALAREQKKGKVNSPDQSIDCVVSIYGFSGAVAAGEDGKGTGVSLRSLAREVSRVLKPGGTLLFVERGDASELVDVMREVLGSVEVNIVQNLVDPYCVALATKTKESDGEGSGLGAATAAQGDGDTNRRSRRMRKSSGSKRG